MYFAIGDKMISKKILIEKKTHGEKTVFLVKAPFPYSLEDTLECGQCFRHELVKKEDGYVEYIVPLGGILARVAQEKLGEVLFFDTDEKTVESVLIPYFSLDTDYGEIKRDIVDRTDSEWLKRAADAAEGIAILRQDPWQTLFSFIISQNNNIPRIRKIVREICAEYGVNISLQNSAELCPIGIISSTPCEEKCKACGRCYTFPSPIEILESPEKMLPSHPGFRYKYLYDAAVRVCDETVKLDEIMKAASYGFTVNELKKIKGVGDKVAACAALFGFGNLEAFPIDVWMKRAIDTYFDGSLDVEALGPYAGIAQQYIFHYIRNIEGK